jgi:hypothetical protein
MMGKIIPKEIESINTTINNHFFKLFVIEVGSNKIF